MPPKKPLPAPIHQAAIGDGNIQIVGNQNVVNQTIIQRITNFFVGDTEGQRAIWHSIVMFPTSETSLLIPGDEQ